VRRAGRRRAGRRRGGWRRAATAAIPFLAAAAILAAGCGGGGDAPPAAPPAKRFPAPIFDALSLGMTRAEVARIQPIRQTLTSAGRNRRVWIYEKRGEYAAELTFDGTRADAPLKRIDVHFGPSGAGSQEYIDRFSRRYGAPDVTRRKAVINAYGDHRHDQYDTIWSDATQYVFLTERVPDGGRGRPVYYLTIKKKEITAGGPPTGYVPPPPPEGEDGKPIDESPF
jgi:hypothetical protein